MTKEQKPVIFLDVDGVLNCWTGKDNAHPEFVTALGKAPGAGEFFKFALENFEVRWLTAWCVGRRELHESSVKPLAWLLDTDAETIRSIEPAFWMSEKTEGIRAVIGDSDREWFWLDDDFFGEEKAWIIDNDHLDRFILVDNFEDEHALSRAHKKLAALIRARSCERKP